MVLQIARAFQAPTGFARQSAGMEPVTLKKNHGTLVAKVHEQAGAAC
jgi:hypothetical protein